MELNDPRQLIQLIDAMLYSMDKAGRKRFLLWVKQKRKVYDFNFPLGGSHDKSSSVDASISGAESGNSEQSNPTEPSAEVVKDGSNDTRPSA